MLFLSITEFLVQYGYTGMGVAAFLAGSFIPFSSEVILTGLFASGLHLWPLIVAATVGNVLGGLFNYSIGRMCNEGWVYRLFRVKEEKLDRSKKQIRTHGAWMGLLAWIPFLGSVITVALGLLRVNLWYSTFTVALGKTVRYILLALLLQGI